MLFKTRHDNAIPVHKHIYGIVTMTIGGRNYRYFVTILRVFASYYFLTTGVPWMYIIGLRYFKHF